MHVEFKMKYGVPGNGVIEAMNKFHSTPCPVRVKLRNEKVGKLSLIVLEKQPQRGVICQPRATPTGLYTSFAQGYERGVKSAMLRAVRAKARISVCLHPSLKAGVNERQIVDNSILLVPKLPVAYVQTADCLCPNHSAITPAIRLRFVMNATCIAAVALLY